MRITKELLELCVDYDRQAQEFRESVKYRCEIHQRTHVGVMKRLDREMAKFECAGSVLYIGEEQT